MHHLGGEQARIRPGGKNLGRVIRSVESRRSASTSPSRPGSRNSTAALVALKSAFPAVNATRSRTATARQPTTRPQRRTLRYPRRSSPPAGLLAARATTTPASRSWPRRCPIRAHRPGFPRRQSRPDQRHRTPARRPRQPPPPAADRSIGAPAPTDDRSVCRATHEYSGRLIRIGPMAVVTAKITAARSTPAANHGPCGTRASRPEPPESSRR